MNNLIPITQVKILKNTWIKTKIKYENEMTIYNLLCKLAYETYLLMNTFEDFNIIIDYTSFIDSFIDMIYRSYIIIHCNKILFCGYMTPYCDQYVLLVKS